jgi:hypothetical protein
MTSGLTPESTKQFMKDAWAGFWIGCAVLYATLMVVGIVQLL